MADTHSIPEAQLPRQRKQPKTIATESSGHSHATPYLHYRQQYFEALDLILACMKDRFDQTGYRVYRNLEVL